MTEQRSCIFCRQELVGKVPPEHVLPSALGGRLTTRNVICGRCNNRFGRTIDNDLADSVSAVRVAARLPAGRSGRTPTYEAVDEAGTSIRIDNRGRLSRIVRRPFSVSHDEEGKPSLSIHTNGIDHLIVQAEHLARKTGESVRSIAADFIGQTIHVERPRTIQENIQFGKGSSQASMVKSLLVLWSLKVGTEELLDARYDRVREYVLNGPEGGYGYTDICANRLSLTGRDKAKFGKNPTFLGVYSDNEGCVRGYFRVYDAVGWHVELARRGAPVGQSIHLASNPHDPAKWVLDGLQLPTAFYMPDPADLPVPYERIDWTAPTSALNDLYRVGFEKQQRDAVRQEVSRMFEDVGARMGECLSGEQRAEITRRTQAFIRLQIDGTPYEYVITNEMLERALTKRGH